MENVNVLSLNCHCFSAGTVAYLKRVSVGVDVIMLKETWLSDIRPTCNRISESLHELEVSHSSAIGPVSYIRISLCYFYFR